MDGERCETEPGTTCSTRLDCSAEYHSASCARVRADIRLADARRECSNYGHDWNLVTGVTMADSNLPLQIVCDRGCGRRYKVVEFE